MERKKKRKKKFLEIAHFCDANFILQNFHRNSRIWPQPLRYFARAALCDQITHFFGALASLFPRELIKFHNFLPSLFLDEEERFRFRGGCTQGFATKGKSLRRCKFYRREK